MRDFLTEDALEAMRDELRKTAGLGDLVAKAAPRLKNVGSLMGTGGLVGAGLGAAGGAVKGVHDAREEGQGGAVSALRGVGGALRGGLLGGAAGATLGAGAGALSSGGAIGNLATGLAAREGRLGGAARFGQRQVHALTGMLSPQELEAIGGGASQARKAYEAANAAIKSAPNDLVLNKATEGALKASKYLQDAETAQNMGLTSVPGYLRSLGKDPMGTLRAGFKEQMHHPVMGALAVGMPLAGAASTALAGHDDPNGGPGRAEKAFTNVGMAAGTLAGTAMPIVGNIAVGEAGRAGGKYLGRAIDRVRGVRPPQSPSGPAAMHPSESQSGQATAEHVLSPSAAGHLPEVA